MPKMAQVKFLDLYLGEAWLIILQEQTSLCYRYVMDEGSSLIQRVSHWIFIKYLILRGGQFCLSFKISHFFNEKRETRNIPTVGSSQSGWIEYQECPLQIL